MADDYDEQAADAAVTWREAPRGNEWAEETPRPAEFAETRGNAWPDDRRR